MTLALAKRRLGVVAIALPVLFGLAACQTPPAIQQANTVDASAASAALLRTDSINGIYEVATNPVTGALYVAASPSFDAKSPGYLYRLDPRTLTTLQTIQLPHRAFALGVDTKTNTIYVGNTLDGSLTVVDGASGTVRSVIQLAQPETDDKGKTSVAHTRKVLVDEKRNRIFVTSPGREGKVWIVDGASAKLVHTIDTGAPWTAGVAFDDAANRLYVSQGGQHEILTIDPDVGTIVRRISTGDSSDNDAKNSKHFFINLAIDVKGQRLFTADSTTNQLYVFDIASGKVLSQVDSKGLGLLDVAFNPVRNEIYVTNRGVGRAQPEGSGALSIIDGARYAIKRKQDLPVHPNSLAVTPNSLAVTPNGITLYVTVKAPHGDKHPAARKDALDSVVRIDLQ